MRHLANHYAQKHPDEDFAETFAVWLTPRARWRRDYAGWPALEKLEFMVSVDIYCNETSRHADVILPPPSLLERGHFDCSFVGLSVRNVANYSPPVFEAEGPSEGEILARLALIFGGQGAQADAAEFDSLMLRGLLEGKPHPPSSHPRLTWPLARVGSLWPLSCTYHLLSFAESEFSSVRLRSEPANALAEAVAGQHVDHGAEV